MLKLPRGTIEDETDRTICDIDHGGPAFSTSRISQGSDIVRGIPSDRQDIGTLTRTKRAELVAADRLRCQSGGGVDRLDRREADMSTKSSRSAENRQTLSAPCRHRYPRRFSLRPDAARPNSPVADDESAVAKWSVPHPPLVLSGPFSRADRRTDVDLASAIASAKPGHTDLGRRRGHECAMFVVPLEP